MKVVKQRSEFMDIAYEVAGGSNCRRRQVGTVIVRNEQILMTSSNGTPTGITFCRDGGCPRCLSETDTCDLYESCLCTHAEQTAIAQATQEGVSIDGATLYCTLRPCLTCVKLCLEAGVLHIVYDQYIKFRAEVENAYARFTRDTRLNLVKRSKTT